MFREALTEAQTSRFGEDRMQFICSFAPAYPTDHPAKAFKSLHGLFAAPDSGDASRKIAIDLYVRTVPLPDGVRAHCFCDSEKPDTCFLVLVNETLPVEEQYQTALGEVFAHVLPRLAGAKGRTNHPPPVF
jgi:hypothetical protein